MGKSNLEDVLNSDIKISPSLETLSNLHNESHEEEIRDVALKHPSIQEFKKNGKLPKEFYDEIKRNSKYAANDPRFKRVLSTGSISDIEEHTGDDRNRARNLVYDHVPGRFYPYKEAMMEGGKALLKLSPFLIGGYFINRSLSSPVSHIKSGKSLLKYLIPGYGPIALGKDIAKTGLKLGPSLVWNTIKMPLMYLGGIYVLYKTIKGFLKGRSERKKAIKFASREQLESMASQLGQRQRDLESSIMQNEARA